MAACYECETRTAFCIGGSCSTIAKNEGGNLLVISTGVMMAVSPDSTRQLLHALLYLLHPCSRALHPGYISTPAMIVYLKQIYCLRN